MDTDADDSNLCAAFIDFLHSFSAGMEVLLCQCFSSILILSDEDLKII